ncbi:hypothetical protein PFISCL1PPCAC_8145, partial [Pristionchus fissidentatus]
FSKFQELFKSLSDNDVQDPGTVSARSGQLDAQGSTGQGMDPTGSRHGHLREAPGRISVRIRQCRSQPADS